MSNNNVIPAESLGQWRSWTMGELGSAAAVPETAPPELAAPAPQPEEPPVEGASLIMTEDEQDTTSLDAVATAAYPTAAELEAIHQEAWQTGYDAGLQAGMQAGEERGRAEGAERALLEAQQQFQQYWQPLSTLQQSFEQELSLLGAQLSQEVLALAVSFAEKMIGEVVRHDPAVLRSLLTEALDSLADSVAQVKVQAHPDELATLQAFLGEQYPQWRMQWQADATLTRGGCRIETPSASIDLTLESRLQLLRKGLGLTDEHAD
ncbi:flagellar assembly protein FliH [Vogesella indigofera]|uniref:Flagellar assembly protein FliH n=1 Tax=Vogesella indigofera TaxID=45465 RepID=A0A495B8K9_VOGIN|nr:FliH/SctL family protein [Vogesella indigofera]RKQ56980.1 flagellar assembly protein FliH [Vogesella indigofera]